MRRKGIIRIDGVLRNNSGVAIGDTVEITKVKAVPAAEDNSCSIRSSTTY